MNPQLVVLSREGAEAYQPNGGKCICISVTDPGTPEANLSPKFAAILRLSFHDLDPREVPAGTQADVGGVVCFMDEDDAGQVVRFAAKHADAETIVIHCEAGVSRSRSIAEGLFDAFARRAPNRYVYQQVADAYLRNYNHLPERWIDYRWTPKRRGPR